MTTEYQEPPNIIQVQDIESIPVHITSSGAEPIRRVAPQYGDAMTWTVDTFANMGQVLQILPRRYRRDKARIYVGSLGNQGVALNVRGSVAAPAANTTIVSTLPQPGRYLVNWTVEIEGAVAAADGDNMKLLFGATTLLIADYPPVAGSYPQPQVQVDVPVGNTAFFTVKSIGAATAGTTYSAQITAIPQFPDNAAVLWLNSNREPLQQPLPQGFMIDQAPKELEWNNQKPCYAVVGPGGGGPIQVSVLDQAYEET